MGEPQEVGALPGSDTEHVPLPLRERPASRVALPARPILHLLRRIGPLRSDYVSREPQQERQHASKASHARDSSLLSLGSRCCRVPGGGFPLLTWQPFFSCNRSRRTHVGRSRLWVSLLTHVRNGPGFYWPERHPDQSELALPEGLSLLVSPR